MPQGKIGVLLIDGNITCGEMLEAFLLKKASSNIPMFAFGVAADATQEEWSLAHHQHQSALNGKVGGAKGQGARGHLR